MKKFKIIMGWVLWILVIAAIITLIIFSDKSYGMRRCSNYTITIHNEGDDTLLFVHDIERIVDMQEQPFIGTLCKNIDLLSLEKAIDKNEYTKEVEVYADIEGDIFIDVYPRRPVVRVISDRNRSFYLDEEGVQFSSRRSSYTLVATGNFGKASTHEDLLCCVRLIKEDPFLAAQIGHIHRNKSGIYALYPVLGKHKIILGPPENFQKGLHNLKLFYKNGMDTEGWKTFKTIDLRFRDQVVCSKK